MRVATDVIRLTDPIAFTGSFFPKEAPISLTDRIANAAQGVGKSTTDGQGNMANVKKQNRHTLPGISRKAIEIIREILTVKQLVEIVLAPLYIVNIVRTSLSFSSLNKDKKIDAGLTIATDVKEIGESTGAFVGALEKIEKIPNTHLAWLGPFAIFMSVLSLAGIIRNIRTCFKVRNLIKEIELAESAGMVDGKRTKACYRNVMDLLDRKANQDSDFINNFFNADENKFADALIAIEGDIADEPEDEKAEKKVTAAIHALKGRLRREIVSSSLAILASTVTIIGTAILLATPAAPVGWVILGTAASVDLVRWAYHKVVEYQFAKTIDLKRTPLEWVLC